MKPAALTPAQRRPFGHQIERQAEDWLIRRGFEILARNIPFKFTEIDLLAWDPQPRELVIIEVRSRIHAPWLSGIEALDPRKAQRLRKAIPLVLDDYRVLRPRGVRLDLVFWDGMSWSHYTNVLP